MEGIHPDRRGGLPGQRGYPNGKLGVPNATRPSNTSGSGPVSLKAAINDSDYPMNFAYLCPIPDFHEVVETVSPQGQR